MIVRELNHVAIRVADMDKSVRLYRDLLGGQVIRDAWAPDGKGHFVYVQLAEGVIELIQGVSGAANLGLQHIAFLTATGMPIGEAVKPVRARGYTFTVEPKLAASGDGYLSFFKDKGGVTYEFIQRDEDIRIPGLKNEKILEFDHISIRVDDETRVDTEEFLTQTLGMSVRKLFEKPGSTMGYYNMGPDTVELLYGVGKPRPEQPIIHIALRVKSAHEMYEYLTENGISCSKVFESGLKGFYITNVTGPDGEIIEFLDRGRMEDFNPPA